LAIFDSLRDIDSINNLGGDIDIGVVV